MKLRPNRVKHKLANGEIAYVVEGLTHPDDIDAFGPAGIDAMWLEGEHGWVDAAELGNLTRACDIWGMTSIVRINRNDQALIYRTLDRGAQGIIVPHVNTKEEAQNVVAGGKFAPIGQRGMYTSRQGYGVPDYLQVADDESLLIILIEDIIAIENLDEILTVDHIDVFFVASSDLAASMGHIGDIGNSEVQKTIDDALARIQAAGRVAGASVANENVAKYSAAGVRFFMTGVDPWLTAGAVEFMQRSESAKKGG